MHGELPQSMSHAPEPAPPPKRSMARLTLIRPWSSAGSLEHFRMFRSKCRPGADAPLGAARPTGRRSPTGQLLGPGRSELRPAHPAFAVPPDWDPTGPRCTCRSASLGDIFNHPEALVYVDGAPVGSADRYHHTLRCPASADGGPHQLSLHGWTGHAGWPPDPGSRDKLFMRECARGGSGTRFGIRGLADAALGHRAILADGPPEKATGLLDRARPRSFWLDTRADGRSRSTPAPEAHEALRTASPRQVRRWT